MRADAETFVIDRLSVGFQARDGAAGEVGLRCWEAYEVFFFLEVQTLNIKS